jgi:hypothetical protein
MRLLVMCLVCATVVAASTATGAGAVQRRKGHTAPETFSAQMQARTDVGAAAASISMQIDRYTPEDDRKVITDALRQGGYPAFLAALRKAKVVGNVTIGDLQVPLRWAREQETPKGRAISLVTDAPLYFVGGGRRDAKPREGFEVAVLQLAVDEFGLGTGTMAAAARVKPDGQGGVLMEDYAEEPIRLTGVYRIIK